MGRLGIRLALAGGRGAVIPLLLSGLAVAVGTAILLFALSFQPALGTRYEHRAWRSTAGDGDASTARRGLLMAQTFDHVLGRPLTRIDVAALSTDAPVPPGIATIPGPGETWLSPALAALIGSMPSDQLGDRFGRIVGIVEAQGLSAPDELYAVNGLPPDVLRAAGARAVERFRTDVEMPAPEFIIQLLVAIALAGALGPVAVFVATATRLAATRRDRRLAALRLGGATVAQVYRLGAIEALLVTVPGALLGVAIFWLLRPAVATVPLDGLGWFPDAISPPTVAAGLLLLAVPLVGTMAAVVALRRLAISPLGVARHASQPRPSLIRLLPVGLSMLGLAAGAVLLDQLGSASLLVLVGSFLGMIAGLVVLGPLVTFAVGRVVGARGGPRRLLAGRRMADEPRGAFGAIAGVVLAVFVASAFYGIVSYAREVSDQTSTDLPSVALSIAVPIDGVGAPPAFDAGVIDLVERSAGWPGLEGIVAVRVAQATVRQGGEPSDWTVWVADCDAVVQVLELAAQGAACANASVHVIDPGLVETRLGGSPLASAAGAVIARLPRLPVDAVMPLFPMSWDAGETPGGTDRMSFGPGPNGFPDWATGLPSLIVDPSLVPEATALLPVARVFATGEAASVERLRTAVANVAPTSRAITGDEAARASSRTWDELGRVVSLGVVGVLLLAGCSLAVAMAGSILDRRRAFALLRSSGVPLSLLRHVVLLEALVPLLVVAAVSALLGSGTMQLLLRSVASVDVPPPDGSLLLVLAVAILGAVAMVCCVLPLVRSMTEMEETRFE